MLFVQGLFGWLETFRLRGIFGGRGAERADT
jgi:hypothetical protein